jgi:hypothetical protein
MDEEIIGVIKPIAQGQPKPSLYFLIPLQLRNRLGINKNIEFVVLLAANDDIIYRQKEA